MILAVAPMGCATTEHFAHSWLHDAPETGEVAQVMVLWADGAVVHPDPTRNGAATPGLAGRVYLFPHGLGTPLAADGVVTVYLYDDQQVLAEKSVPREVWNIDEENLERVLKRDGLGWGYDLWLPWNNYRPDIKRISLVAKYTPKEGKPAWSDRINLSIASEQGPKSASHIRTSATTQKSSAMLEENGL